MCDIFRKKKATPSAAGNKLKVRFDAKRASLNDHQNEPITKNNMLFKFEDPR